MRTLIVGLIGGIATLSSLFLISNDLTTQAVCIAGIILLAFVLLGLAEV